MTHRATKILVFRVEMWEVTCMFPHECVGSNNHSAAHFEWFEKQTAGGDEWNSGSQIKASALQCNNWQWISFTWYGGGACMCVCMCVSPTEDLFDGSSICVLVNPHCVTHTPSIPAVVCLFKNSLAHSIPNAKALKERGSRINLCTYSTWETNVSIIYISPTVSPAAGLHPSILHSHWHHSSF